MDAQAEPVLRRRPQQVRSQERLARVLDACAAVLDEAGYEALSTTVVARRAGVPVGSVYQFFPDKRAMVAALIGDYLARFEREASAAFERARPSSWADVVDVLVGTYRDMHLQAPGFRRVHWGDRVDRRLLAEDRTNNVVVVERIVPLVAAATGLPAAALARPVLVAVEAADGLFSAALADGAAQEDLLGETRTLLALYLEHRLGRLAPPPPPAAPAADPA